MTVFTSNFLAELDRLDLDTTPKAARFLGVGERQVARWKDGLQPRWQSLTVLADAFGRDVVWLITDHTNEETPV